MPADHSPASPRQPRPPKRITRSRIRNVALAYVRRYGGSAARVRAVLQRRVDRSLRFHDEQPRAAECLQWIEEVIAELTASKVLDEQRQARGEALRHALAGRPRRVIAQRLQVKGFDKDTIEGAIGSLDQADDREREVDPDWVACCRYARRRRLGPFQQAGRGERSRERQLQSLMRAGFPYRLASRIVDADDAAELEAVILDAPTPTLYL